MKKMKKKSIKKNLKYDPGSTRVKQLSPQPRS